MEVSNELRMSAYRSMLKQTTDYTTLVEQQMDEYSDQISKLRLENTLLREDNERLKRFNMELLDKIMKIGDGSVGTRTDVGIGENSSRSSCYSFEEFWNDYREYTEATEDRVPEDRSTTV